MNSKDDLAGIIVRIIGDTLSAKDRPCPDLDRDSPVDERLGLDSLDWAAVVVRLEMETGIDPFAQGPAGELKTVSDLVDLYAAARRQRTED